MGVIALIINSNTKININNLLMGADTVKVKIPYYDGSYYEGEVDANNKQHGVGTIHYVSKDVLIGYFSHGYANGNSYEGNMYKNTYHGPGKLISEGGKRTDAGLFRHGKLVHGKITTQTGVYTGSIQNGMREGKGYLKESNGIMYLGSFKKDKFEGSGIFKMNDVLEYRGEFKNGLHHGKGTIENFLGKNKNFCYTGDFIYGNFNGNGKVTYQNGDTYEGEFQDGKKHGKGVYTSQAGVYDGNYDRDLKCDKKGVFRFKSGVVYTGGFFEDEYSGHGKLVSSTNEMYEGAFSKGMKHGKGKLVTENMEYEGFFKNNLKDGQGKLTNLSEKKQYEGGFKEDRKHGEGVTTKQGTNQSLKATYLDGIKNGPYEKRVGATYIQTGTYLNDMMHGEIKIKNREVQAVYLYEMGEKKKEQSISGI